MEPYIASHYTLSYSPLNSASILGIFTYGTLHTLALTGYTCVCFFYTHPILSRSEALCVALQASIWQVFNEEGAVVITKSVICHLVFKSADNFPS